MALAPIDVCFPGKPQRIELPVLAAGTAFHSIIHCVPGHSFLRIPAASSQVTEKHLETAMTALLIGYAVAIAIIFVASRSYAANGVKNGNSSCCSAISHSPLTATFAFTFIW